MPDIYVLAGPNGAGKSTAARLLLPDFLNCVEFVNADEIARGLSAFRPEGVAFRAGRVMLERLNALARQGTSFAFETTLASRTFAPWLRKFQMEGFEVHILYVWLSTSELARARVERRVEAGGHSIPSDDIIRRYKRSRENFLRIFAPLANTWQVYDNSREAPALVAFGARAQTTNILLDDVWRSFSKIEQ